MAAPLNLRFRYHFDGNRTTNRLEKPEWFFSHILNTIYEHREFIEVETQPLLASFSPNASALEYFIRELCQPAKTKIESSMKSLLEAPSLLAHTIFQALEFDQALQDLYGLEIQSVDSVSHVILDNGEWFASWKEAERKGQSLPSRQRSLDSSGILLQLLKTSTTKSFQLQTHGSSLKTTTPLFLSNQLCQLYVCVNCSRASPIDTGLFLPSAIACPSSLRSTFHF